MGAAILKHSVVHDEIMSTYIQCNSSTANNFLFVWV